MLLRDVDNLRNFFGQYAPALLATRFGPEIWALYAAGLLVPGMPLTGRYERKAGEVDLSGLLREIEDARLEEAARLLRMG
jgi:RIO kinase 1